MSSTMANYTTTSFEQRERYHRRRYRAVPASDRQPNALAAKIGDQELPIAIPAPRSSQESLPRTPASPMLSLLERQAMEGELTSWLRRYEHVPGLADYLQERVDRLRQG